MSAFENATFYTTINHLQDLPTPNGIEIAFVGRSNAGKSSAINTLIRRDRLAYVSKTPGRTQYINFFKLGDKNFLVDLPGYGYAKVPLKIRQHWDKLLGTYLETRQALHGMVLIMDIRHPLTKLDRNMLDWFSPTGKPVHILLTKADKVTRNQAVKILHNVTSMLGDIYPQCSAQLFSSTSKAGIDEAYTVLNNWLGLNSLSHHIHNQKTSNHNKNPRLKGRKPGADSLNQS
tara:strand:+ start:201 stop:896 length:696 start_codon:yes stop_codon:yes gene_type:complete